MKDWFANVDNGLLLIPTLILLRTASATSILMSRTLWDGAEMRVEEQLSDFPPWYVHP